MQDVFFRMTYLENSRSQSAHKKEDNSEPISAAWAVEQETQGNCEQQEFQGHGLLPAQLLYEQNGEHDTREFSQGGPQQVCVVFSVQVSALSWASLVQLSIQEANIVTRSLKELSGHEHNSIVDKAAASPDHPQK